MIFYHAVTEAASDKWKLSRHFTFIWGYLTVWMAVQLSTYSTALYGSAWHSMIVITVLINYSGHACIWMQCRGNVFETEIATCLRNLLMVEFGSTLKSHFRYLYWYIKTSIDRYSTVSLFALNTSIWKDTAWCCLLPDVPSRERICQTARSQTARRS